MWTFFQALHSGKRSARKSGARGFTLIELLVVVSIMVIMTSIFLLRQQRFNSATILRSLAYSVGLSVRQAQVYGTSIRESGPGAFNTPGAAARAYGVHFSSGSTNSYTLFADLNNDGQYTVSPSEVVQVFSIGQGYTISRFCVTTSGGTPIQRCSDTSSLTSMSILFKRPNPDACFAGIGGGASANACQTGAVPSETYSTGCMRIRGGGGDTDTRSVIVSLTGQISIGGTGTCGPP